MLNILEGTFFFQNEIKGVSKNINLNGCVKLLVSEFSEMLCGVLTFGIPSRD